MSEYLWLNIYGNYDMTESSCLNIYGDYDMNVS